MDESKRRSQYASELHAWRRITCKPWLVRRGGLSAGLGTKGSPIPVRTQGWVAGQVPTEGCARGNHPWMFLSLSFPLPSPLKIDKWNLLKIKKEWLKIRTIIVTIKWLYNEHSCTHHSILTDLEMTFLSISDFISECYKPFKNHNQDIITPIKLAIIP